MLRFKESPLSAEIVPTVFITNECLQQLDSSAVPELAQKITTTISTINQNNAIENAGEVQLDCDWSASTREKYFNLLKEIKKQLQGIQLSATIRLYQVKYKESAGIPPVDKGMLMCYNMGNLKSINSKNSIIETAELEKYIGQLPDYPLPLDVAFPVFDWKVWFRDGKYYGITEEFPTELLSSSVFIKTGNNYQVLKDTLLAGYELKKNDLLRWETSNAKTVQAAANMISSRLKNTQTTVALYHLDSVILKKYSLYELESYLSLPALVRRWLLFRKISSAVVEKPTLTIITLLSFIIICQTQKRIGHSIIPAIIFCMMKRNPFPFRIY
jgi:hypothetical protein